MPAQTPGELTQNGEPPVARENECLYDVIDAEVGAQIQVSLPQGPQRSPPPRFLGFTPGVGFSLSVSGWVCVANRCGHTEVTIVTPEIRL